jgi:hypothetical protein
MESFSTPFTYIYVFRLSPNRWFRFREEVLWIHPDSDFECRDVKMVWLAVVKRIQKAVAKRLLIRSAPDVFHGVNILRAGTAVHLELKPSSDYKIPMKRQGGCAVEIQLILNGMKHYTR